MTDKDALLIRNSVRMVCKHWQETGELLERIEKSPLLSKMKYTYLHRLFVNKVKQDLGIDEIHFYLHDCDKLCLYLVLNDEKLASSIHKMLEYHHNRDKKELTPDLYEQIKLEKMVDWESARYSKPDKPRNAFDTLNEFYPEQKEEMLPVLKKYGLDHPTPANSSIDKDKYAIMESYVEAVNIKKDIDHYLDNSKHFVITDENNPFGLNIINKLKYMVGYDVLFTEMLIKNNYKVIVSTTENDRNCIHIVGKDYKDVSFTFRLIPAKKFLFFTLKEEKWILEKYCDTLLTKEVKWYETDTLNFLMHEVQKSEKSTCNCESVVL